MCKAIRDLMDDSREESRVETKREIIINMLKENLPLEVICRVAECDEDFVEEVKKNM